MNFSGSLLVAARGSAVAVSCRGIGSANGNRTCKEPVQLSTVQSICLSLRRSGSGTTPSDMLRIADVAARWQRTSTNIPQVAPHRAVLGSSQGPCRRAFPERSR
jgi:hypothetical protein